MQWLSNLGRSKQEIVKGGVSADTQKSKRRGASAKAPDLRVALEPRPESVAIHEMGPFRLRAVLRGDVTAVAPFLRETDLLDIAATTRLPPLEALARSVASSQRAFAVDYKDRCVALGGTTHIPNVDRTSIWLLGSEGFDKGLRAGGWRLCKPWFDIMADEASVLFAVLPEANTRDMRWLEWMGFRPEAHIPNYRGLGHTCVRMICDRRTPSERDTSKNPSASNLVHDTTTSIASSSPQQVS